jgi:hypothetical protein
MRKDDERLKPPKRYKQGNLFAGRGGARGRPEGGTDRSAMRAELFSRLAEQRSLTTVNAVNR